MTTRTKIKKVLLLISTLSTSLSLVACGSPTTLISSTPEKEQTSSVGQSKKLIQVPVSETEDFIETTLREKAAADTKVTCPSQMEGQIGDFFICLVENLTIPSDSHFADVQIMNELGEISFVVRRD